jgi:hypothetical protein
MLRETEVLHATLKINTMHDRRHRMRLRTALCPEGPVGELDLFVLLNLNRIE